MNQIISCQLTPKQIADLQAKISPEKLNFRVQYTVFQAKLTGCTITAYTSGKVVFAGEDEVKLVGVVVWFQAAQEECERYICKTTTCGRLK